MAKTLETLYEEVMKSPELQKEIMGGSDGHVVNLEAFVKAHGCEATAEEADAFMKKMLNEPKELSVDELDQVAGGGAYDKPAGPSEPAKPKVPYCPQCGGTESVFVRGMTLCAKCSFGLNLVLMVNP